MRGGEAATVLYKKRSGCCVCLPCRCRLLSCTSTSELDVVPQIQNHSAYVTYWNVHSEEIDHRLTNGFTIVFTSLLELYDPFVIFRVQDYCQSFITEEPQLFYHFLCLSVPLDL